MYHKITKEDLIEISTEEEEDRLSFITDINLEEALAKRWCELNNYKLGGYIGQNCWDSWRKEN